MFEIEHSRSNVAAKLGTGELRQLLEPPVLNPTGAVTSIPKGLVNYEVLEYRSSSGKSHCSTQKNAVIQFVVE